VESRITDPMKVVIAFFASEHFMKDINANPRLSMQYKAMMFDRIMADIQDNFFRDIHPQEALQIVEKAQFLFNQMKEHIDRKIMGDANSQSGFGVDKPLGKTDIDLHSDEPVKGVVDEKKS